MVELKVRSDRSKGCMWGLAIGDALGAAVEFMHKGTFAPVTHYRTGTHNLEPGEFTDDTQMAIAVALAILEKGSLDTPEIMRNFVAWRNRDVAFGTRPMFDIGGQTSRAISDYVRTGRLTSEQGEGNGSIMRLAPVIAYATETATDDDEIFQTCSDHSALTHPAHEARESCGILGSICARLIKSDQSSIESRCLRVIRSAILDSPADRSTEVFELCMEAVSGTRTPNGSGHCSDTLADAIHHVRSAVLADEDPGSTFRRAVLSAANGGGDSDTVAAVAGQIAGAMVGLSRIPGDLVAGIRGAESIIAATAPRKATAGA